jgi:predicted phosphodiesterase
VRIGLASDSFGNLDALDRALEIFTRAPVDRVFFLGGRWGDVDAVLARRRGARETKVPETDLEFLSAIEGALSRAVLEQGGAPTALPAGRGGTTRGDDPLAARIVRVASRACPEYAGAAPKKIVDLVEGHICCLVHDKAELTRDDITNATVLFHGNSGHAALVQFGPRVFVTPGHLRSPAPEGRPASFGVVEVAAREIALTVYSAEGAELRRDRATVGGGSKLSAR